MPAFQIEIDEAESQSIHRTLQNYVIAIGKITDFNLVGPFEDFDTALSYGESILWKENWEIIPIYAPEAIS